MPLKLKAHRGRHVFPGELRLQVVFGITLLKGVCKSDPHALTGRVIHALTPKDTNIVMPTKGSITA